MDTLLSRIDAFSSSCWEFLSANKGFLRLSLVDLVILGLNAAIFRIWCGTRKEMAVLPLLRQRHHDFGLMTCDCAANTERSDAVGCAENFWGNSDTFFGSRHMTNLDLKTLFLRPIILDLKYPPFPSCQCWSIAPLGRLMAEQH